MEAIFTDIYTHKMWGGSQYSSCYFSGSGSVPNNTREYRHYVQNFIKDHDIKTVLDVGCGDFQVAKLIDWTDITYIGIDVVTGLIANNIRQYSKPNISFSVCDITSDDLPDAELCLIRQVFQHFSNQDILTVLAKLKKFKYILITDGLPVEPISEKNIDKPTNRYNRFGNGNHSGLYLDEPPFNLNGSVVLNYKSQLGTEMFRTLLLNGAGKPTPLTEARGSMSVLND